VKYQATLDREAHELDVTARGEGLYEVVLDGTTYHVDAHRLVHGAVSLIVDHASYSVEFEEHEDGRMNVMVRDHVFGIEVLDERALRLRGAGSRFTLEGPQTVTAPMPGKVVKLLVKVGDEVTEGQGLVVVEAMKMENELGSPKAGKVKEITAREGTSVEGGAPLVVVD
jgi:biotin carboxyl carrier protein